MNYRLGGMMPFLSPQNSSTSETIVVARSDPHSAIYSPVLPSSVSLLFVFHHTNLLIPECKSIKPHNTDL
jgi:hypothetical protein